MKKRILLFTMVILGSILTGCSSSNSVKDPINTTDKFPTEAVQTIPNNTDANIVYETIQVGFNGTSLVPEVTNLVAGKNYKFIVTPTSDGIGAMTTMTIAGIDKNVYNIKKDVPITILINDAKTGIYESVCEKYKMYQGQIVVE